MALSKSKSSLFDPFRKSLVAATPEEKVRQDLLQYMIEGLGFPKHLLVVEKQLSQLPHLEGVPSLPKRRADILCFAKGIHPEFSLYPLLLIECKEGEVGKDAADQALGYNHYVRAPFVAIAGDRQTKMVFPKELPFLPTYAQLLESISS